MHHPQLELVQDGRHLLTVGDDLLIRRFKIKNKNKIREVNDPHPDVKETLKRWNKTVTDYYIDALNRQGVSQVAHAYLPNKSIQSNARAHLHSPIIQFDFKGFYDSCQFDYFADALRELDPTLTPANEHVVKRLVIDPQTGGVTQGLPVSGALAGITLIPFWKDLKAHLPDTIRFTQYSDDLTFSYSGRTPKEFTVPILTQKIYESLKRTGLDFQLNTDKTRSQTAQFRKVTGIRINNHNQMTPSRADYRFIRHALYILSKSDNLDKELAAWGFKSKEAFVGKISFIRSIDQSGKVNRQIAKYSETCRRHNLFVTWLDQYSRQSAFA